MTEVLARCTYLVEPTICGGRAVCWVKDEAGAMHFACVADRAELDLRYGDAVREIGSPDLILQAWDPGAA